MLTHNIGMLSLIEISEKMRKPVPLAEELLKNELDSIIKLKRCLTNIKLGFEEGQYGNEHHQ
ncbi:hypothetical protein ACFX4I_16075 [Peribacillus sp. YIM B13472]|uniref:hypothetical protein n=1 Tax=Peribacillus sp. YIM B13472 TaxID=3366297 RepID=UPI00366FA785